MGGWVLPLGHQLHWQPVVSGFCVSLQVQGCGGHSAVMKEWEWYSCGVPF
jgi:hypothetical protein